MMYRQAHKCPAGWDSSHEFPTSLGLLMSSVPIMPGHVSVPDNTCRPQTVIFFLMPVVCKLIYWICKVSLMITTVSQSFVWKNSDNCSGEPKQKLKWLLVGYSSGSIKIPFRGFLDPGVEMPPEAPLPLQQAKFEKDLFCYVGQYRTKSNKISETEVGQHVNKVIVWMNCCWPDYKDIAAFGYV